MEEPLVVLDLAMVFGSRLWGHDMVATARPADAPGLGDLYTHEWRRTACNLLVDRVAGALGEMPDAWRALVLHTGSEAVETAIKTALRADKDLRHGMHAFHGA
jgi:4-aminobutyrate aminotransferase-like enzyme